MPLASHRSSTTNYEEHPMTLSRVLKLTLMSLLFLSSIVSKPNRAKGDLILAGQLMQSEGNNLNHRLSVVQNYLTGLQPYLASHFGSGPAFSSPGEAGFGLIFAGQEIQAGNLFAAGGNLQFEGIILNSKFNSIDSYIISNLTPFLSSHLGTSGPLFLSPGEAGIYLSQAGQKLQSGDLFGAGTDLQSEGLTLNTKVDAIDNYITNLGSLLTTRLGPTGHPLYFNPGQSGIDLISSGIELQAVPEPSSFICGCAVFGTFLVQRYRRTKR
jgi:hypothetical protein